MSDRRQPYIRSGIRRVAIASQLRAAYEAGASVVELVERHGISRSTVKRLLNEAGTDMRPAGRPALRPVRGPADLDRLVDSWRSGA
ncbi:helix-turn-helix domain-containing protein [Streptomyces chartreusis]|uniref:helix-turn-helix domain-containing protein n=1 Tax=Streptomyces chartreusis TaxID=1969 RepID=UPI00380C488F